ncbi:hypothetical protein R50073_26650 [Maricurvus nonylphenolicus]
MGDPVRIADLAKKMVHLSGLEVKSAETPDGDIEIKYTGLRPGEKLYEELLIGDNTFKTQHPRILRAEEQLSPWENIQTILNQLKYACENQQQEEARKILLQAPTEYAPQKKRIQSDAIC